MKSYLDLIRVSAKVHRRQNRMVLLCIILAVFLVTAIFSMADMGVRMEKTRLLRKQGSSALNDFSSNPTVQTLYFTAILLFILILVAGVLMISSSINSNVTQRTKFFGMMRCIGMSKQQIIRFVKWEALNWCKTAVPIGVVLGIAVTWGLCVALRFFVGGEFSEIPLWGISLMGIISGIIAGVMTVLIAASSPAKRAAKVSPITAVSGNSENRKNIANTTNIRFYRVETALGINHAISSKKNLLLMTSSFALSIILFLSFSVLIDFVGYLIPQFSNTSDINISSSDGLNSINGSLINKISAMDGVNHVFGRRSSLDVPVKLKYDRQRTSRIDLISYDKYDLDCIIKDKLLRKGSDISKVYGDRAYVLAVWDENIPIKTGDKIQIGNEEIEVAGMLKYNPFSSDGKSNGKITLITSSETFVRLTGMTGYSLIMIQTTSSASNENVTAISNMLDENCRFYDRREQRTASTYLAFQIFIYGFLGIIILVTVLNIINCIAMSVSARIKQYGAMRAVGMDDRQIAKMIVAEALTYASYGCTVGCIAGLVISKQLYDTLITRHFNHAIWSLPVIPLLIILLFVFGATIAAAYIPSKRIRNTSIIETLNEL